MFTELFENVIGSPFRAQGTWTQPLQESLRLVRRRTAFTGGDIHILRRMEGDCQHDGSGERHEARHEEQTSEIHDAGSRIPERVLDEVRADAVRHQYTQTKHHHVKETLRARSHILRKIGIYENVDRGEKERVADAMNDLHADDQPRALRE